MRGQFTAIYERGPDGVVTACVAEFPEVKVEAKTLEAARALLAKTLRTILEGKRRETLAGVSPKARVERVGTEVRNRPGTGAGASKAPAKARKSRRSRLPDLMEVLLREGLIDRIPALDQLDTDRLEPIPIQGKPISEEIIEDRR